MFIRRLVLAWWIGFPSAVFAESVAKNDVVVGGACVNRWEEFSSKPYEQIALPDTNASYWRLRFRVPSGQRIALRLRGKFPYARYASFNIYDAISKNSSASLHDSQLVADHGSTNPFIIGQKRDTAQRNYTIWALPTDAVPQSSNSLYMPKAKTDLDQVLELWYRVYVSDHSEQADGGVGLPAVEAFDADTLQALACPNEDGVKPSLLEASGSLPPKNQKGKISMFRSRATGLYGNLDNIYLATRMPILAGSVVELSFKAPKTPRTGRDMKFWTGDEDMRYWSFCLGGYDQRTSSCLDDAHALVDSQGYVHLTIGPESIRNSVEKKRHNFLPWGRQLLQVLIYRNMLTRADFSGHLNNVRIPDGSLDDFAAEAYIHEYAPAGVSCSLLQYHQGACGS